MGRSPCCSKEGLNRGAWTALEDELLTSYIKAHGHGKWGNLPKRAGLKRCGKSCRLRWLNYLRPDIKRGNITHDEEELIIRLHKLLGNRWSLIAGRLPGRTDNEIKNYWNTTLSKKLKPQSSPESSQQRPSTPITQPQVIHPKPTRCKNVLITINQSQTSHTTGPKPQSVHENQNPDVNFLSSGSNEFQVNALDFCTDFSNMPMNAHSLPIDQLMVDWWTAANEFQDNASMDLDSVGLLLDSVDWP